MFERITLHRPGASEPLVTPAHILISISDTRRDLTIGSSFGSEFAMSPTSSAIAACKFSDLVNKASTGQERVSVFQEDVLDDLPNIRDAVNSGARNFSDVVRLVEKAKQFKEWLRKQDDDEHLRKAYLRDVTHMDWADKLPPKTLENSRRDRRTEPIVRTVPLILSAEDQGILGLSRKLEK